MHKATGTPWSRKMCKMPKMYSGQII